MNADFKMFARLFVDVRRAQYAVDALSGRQGHRADDGGAGAFCCLDNLIGRLIEQSVIVRLQANADSLNLGGSGSVCLLFCGTCH